MSRPQGCSPAGLPTVLPASWPGFGGSDQDPLRGSSSILAFCGVARGAHGSC